MCFRFGNVRGNRHTGFSDFLGNRNNRTSLCQILYVIIYMVSKSVVKREWPRTSWTRNFFLIRTR